MNILKLMALHTELNCVAKILHAFAIITFICDGSL